MSQPFDAVLLVALGGPQGRDDVRPFLANVLRGRLVHGVSGHRGYSYYLVIPGRECSAPGDYPPSDPLVLGTSSLARGSIAIAARRARARPLKQDSAM